MKQIILLSLCFFLMSSSLFAQFSVKNGVMATKLDMSLNNMDEVFVFDGGTNGGNGEITFTHSNITSFKWYTYSTNPASKVLKQTDSNTLSASLISPETGGYVLEFNGQTKYFWVFEEKNNSFDFKSITATRSSTPCTTVSLNVVFTKLPELKYYNSLGINQTLPREFKVSYNTLEWNETNSTYTTIETIVSKDDFTYSTSEVSSTFEVDAPYLNTYFTIKGDQFLISLGKDKSAVTDMEYETVAVTQHLKAEIAERDALNEQDRTKGTLGGSAPLNILFTSNSNVPTAQNFQWYISSAEDEGNSILYADEDLRYTFKSTGLFKVKLNSSNNAGCDVNDSTTVNVVESFLEVPNVFTPNGDGKNDEFRVAYKSLVKYTCVVYNRWGRKVYQGSDPGKGWDGRIAGRMAAPGAYYYVIEATGSDIDTDTHKQVKYKKTGDINLIRGK